MTTDSHRPHRDPSTCGPDKPLLCCEGLVVGHRGRALLPPIDFTIFHHQLCVVVGRNGAGKTTWFRTVLGLLPPVRGRIETCGPRLPKAYIPQRAHLDPIVPLRAWDVAAMGLDRGRHYLRPLLGRPCRERVAWALGQVGATELGPSLFRELSDGQQQRVLMARMLASGPELAVLDEPTAAMDAVAERETLGLIDRLRREHGLAVMIVSHHLAVVAEFADLVVFLDRDSQQVVTGTPAEVAAHPAFRARYGERAGLVGRRGDG